MRLVKFGFRLLAVVMFSLVAAVPHDLRAASDTYTQAPGEFRETAEVKLIELQDGATSLMWTAESSGNDSTFTGSFLDSNFAPLAEATMGHDSSKSSSEKGPGAKVPEPATLFLAGAGLLGLARLSGKAKLVSK